MNLINNFKQIVRRFKVLRWRVGALTVIFSFSFLFLILSISIKRKSNNVQEVTSVPHTKFQNYLYHKYPSFLYSIINSDGSFDLLIGSRHYPTNYYDTIHASFNLSEGIVLDQISKTKIGDIKWVNDIIMTDDTLFVVGGCELTLKYGSISYVKHYSRNIKINDWNLLETDYSYSITSIRYIENEKYAGQHSGQLLGCRRSRHNDKTGDLVLFDGTTHKYIKVLSDCDYQVEPIDLNGDGIQELIIPLQKPRQLLLLWTEHPDGDYTKTGLIRHKIIDNLSCIPLKIEVFDVDNDGGKDVLLSCKNPLTSSVELSVYEFIRPSIESKNISAYVQEFGFRKRVLLDNIGLNTLSFENKFSTMETLFAFKFKDLKFPVIFLSTGTHQNVYMIFFKDYTKIEFLKIHDCRGIVGKIDYFKWGDNNLHVFIPCYTSNYIAEYKVSV